MRPCAALLQHRAAIHQTADRFRATNLRVMGSVLHGNDAEAGDLDLLVDPMPGTTLLDIGGLQDELEQLLGVRVDVVTPRDLPERWRVQVLAEARLV